MNGFPCAAMACSAAVDNPGDYCERHVNERPPTAAVPVRRELTTDEQARLRKTLPVGTTVNNGRLLTNRKERRKVAAALRRGGAKF